jgi:hypothetical protein
MAHDIDEVIHALKLPEMAALVVLMAEGRKLSNPELGTWIGQKGLEKESRDRLNGWKLIESKLVKRVYWHDLTDRGWLACRQLHRRERPARSGSAGGALSALLCGVDRGLTQQRLSPAEFFWPHEPESGRSPAGVSRTTNPHEADQLVRGAYRQLAAQPGDWVSLADLRDQLAKVAPADVNSALRRLAAQSEVHIVPAANLKSLRQRDRDAALWLGLDYSHLLSIEGR